MFPNYLIFLNRWSIEKPKLDNARRLGGIYFIDPEDMEFKKIIKNARRKLETPMAPAMPCKTCKKSKHGETRSKTYDFKSKFACILEASESTRMRMEESLPKYHEDHIAGKGTIHFSITIWYTNLFLCLKPWRFPHQKQQWINNGRNWKRFRCGTKQSQKQIRGDRWSKDEGRKSVFCLTDGHLSFEECRSGGKAPKIQRSSCTPRWHCKRRFGVLCSIHRTRIISITNDGSKSHGYHFQIARVRRTSSGRSICLYSGQNGRCTDVTETSIVRMSRHLDLSTTTQKWPKSWSSTEDPVVLLERNLYGHPLAGLLWDRQIEKILLKYGCEKVFNWECFFVHREKGLFLSVYVDDIKLAGKKI